VKSKGAASLEKEHALGIILQKSIKSDLDVARGISIIEDLGIETSTLKGLTESPFLRDAFCVGITGAPGVGKSTFINKLISTQDFGIHKVAILAIDPSSRITKGAVLGDRIRITHNSVFEEIYFRSLATRGAYGGLSNAIEPILFFLTRCGFTLVLVETVGVGQNEIEIADYADVVIQVLDSNAGDDIQMEKAGLMEVSHIFFVNIRDGQINKQFISNLKSFTSHSSRPPDNNPKVVVGSVLTGDGFDEISIHLNAFLNYFESDGDKAK
jgi:LAO/AO transport system kinase